MIDLPCQQQSFLESGGGIAMSGLPRPQALDEAFVRQLANTIGPTSASFKILENLAKCRRRGEDVRLFAQGCRLVILPSDPVITSDPDHAVESAFPKVPACGARTRSGRSCRQPGMSNGRCRIHGAESPLIGSSFIRQRGAQLGRDIGQEAATERQHDRLAEQKARSDLQPADAL